MSACVVTSFAFDSAAIFGWNEYKSLVAFTAAVERRRELSSAIRARNGARGVL